MTNPPAITINHRTGTGAVFGMHEGHGPVNWKRLATGGSVDGRIQAWDYASLPAGSLIGFHEHLNCEEVWIVLRGTGDFAMEKVPRPLTAGDVMRTPVGGSHSMLNPNDAESDVEFLVVTLAQPESGLPVRSGGEVARSEVRSLDAGPVQYVDAEGSSITAQRITIEPDVPKTVGGVAHQCLVYTLVGDLTMDWLNDNRMLSEGSSLAMPQGQTVQLAAAGSEPCQILEIQLTRS